MDSRLDEPGAALPPLLPVTLGLLAGIGASAILRLSAWPWIATLLLAGGAHGQRARMLCAGAVGGLVLGAAAGATQPSEQRPLPMPAWLEVEGRVRAVAPPNAYTQRFLMDATWLGSAPGRWRVDARIRVTLWHADNRGGSLPGLSAEDRVRCVLRLEPPEPPFVGTLRGRLPDARALTVLPAARGLVGGLLALRRRGAACFDTHLDRRDAGLARALLLGDRSALQREDRRTFRDAGQAHLLAVSGIHVGLLLAGVIGIATCLGMTLRGSWLLGLVTAVFYVPFTGAPPSAVRAGCAAAVYFVGRLLDRPPRSLAVLTLVGASILVTSPLSLSRVSFQLSFAAVIGILTLAPRLYDALVPPRPAVPGVARRKAAVRGALCVAAAAWLGTAPFVALHIGRLCPAGAILSVPAVPLAALALGFGFLLLLGAPLPWIADLGAWGFHVSTTLLRDLLDMATQHGLGTQPVRAPSGIWLLIYGTAFVGSVRARGRTAWLARAALPALVALLFIGADDSVGGRRMDPNEYHARAVPMHHPVFPHALAEPEGLALLAGGLVLFALLSVRPLRWLTAGGAAAAAVLGIAAGWRFGWGGLAAVFAPFTVATLLSKLPGRGRSGARTLRQVVCNGLPALIGCLLAAAGRPAEGLAFFLGALACLGSDTCATEIGARYGGRVWRLVGSGPIRRGESGGVTHLGQFAALGGALLAPAAFALVAGAPLPYVGALTAAGMAGSLIDSAVGGTLQYRGIDPHSGEVVEARKIEGEPTTHHSGLRWLTNDAVNLVSGLGAGALAVGLAGIL